MTLSFRKIAPPDVPALFAIRTSVRENPYSMEALAVQGIDVETVTASLGATHDGYLCEADGRPAGFAMANLSAGELWVIAVLPACEARGIGRELLRLTEDLLWSAGHASIWLWTGPDRSTRAYSLYIRSGWIDSGIRDQQLFMTKTRPGEPTFGERNPGATYIVRPGIYAVILDDQKRVAVLQTPNGCYLPGGGIETGESPEAALHRELLEECDARIEILREVGRATDLIYAKSEDTYFEKHGTYYLARLTSTPASNQVAWLPTGEPGQLTNKSFRQQGHAWAVRRALEKTR